MFVDVVVVAIWRASYNTLRPSLAVSPVGFALRVGHWAVFALLNHYAVFLIHSICLRLFVCLMLQFGVFRCFRFALTWFLFVFCFVFVE